MANEINTARSANALRHCLMCNDEDNEEMFTCSVCRSIFHKHCAGTTLATSSRTWRCCTCAELAESGVDVSQFARTSMGTPSGAPATTTALNSPSSDGRQIERTEQRISRHDNSTSTATAILPSDYQQPTSATRQMLPNDYAVTSEVFGEFLQQASTAVHVNETCDGVTAVTQTHPHLCSVSPALVASEAFSTRGRCFQQRMQLLEEELRVIQKKQQLLAEMEKGELLERETQIMTNEPGPPATHNQAPLLRAADCAAKTNMQAAENSTHQSGMYLPAPPNAFFQRAPPIAAPQFGQRFSHSSFQPRAGTYAANSANVTTSRLTSDHIAARKGLCKDLPKFTGKPEEWPLFKASYDQSTELCGFSDAENLIRLRQAVDGPARNAVKNLVLHASCVPQIIATLQMKFGRPELIIDVLLTQIRELPPPKESKLESIVDFAIEVQNICATMKASSLTNHLNNPEFEQELVCKLPGLLPAFWGMQKISFPSHNLEDFSKWLFQLAEGANAVIIPSTAAKQRKRGSLNAHVEATVCEHTTIASCITCSSGCDAVSSCNALKQLNRLDKWKIVREHSLCKRCLRHHNFEQCNSTKMCGIGGCRCAHHYLLHKVAAPIQASAPRAPQQSSSVGATCNAHSQEGKNVLFRLLPVTLYGNGVQITTHAFFDDGSSLTLMDEELQRELNLEGFSQPLCLKWTGDTHRFEDDSVRLNIELSALGGTKRYTVKNVHTVKRLQLPLQSLDAEKLKTRYKHLRGVPLLSYTDAVPRLLIGVDNSKLGTSLKSKEGSSSDPIAEKTRLGWTIKGPVSTKTLNKLRSVDHVYHVCECDSAQNEELLKLVRDYICLDNVDITVKPNLLSDDNQRAISQLEQRTVRRGDRFETSLLWRCENALLPDSYPMALRRAKCLRQKIDKDPELAAVLEEKIRNYISKGYARVLRDEELNSEHCWYLPIFPVTNPNKPGKVRLVWDAAAKVNTVSLNSLLLKGPYQLSSLVSILRRFRQRRIAVCGDIAEMFHQVRVREVDQHFQRFIWFAEGATLPTIYVLQVMTFGASCSPSCAQFVKNLNATQFETKYPRAVKSIIENHYVDDMLDSVDTESEAVRLAREVHYVHSQAGFEIRNWVSNSVAVIEELGSPTTSSMRFTDESGLTAEKILGMWWLTEEDCFTFTVSTKMRNRDILAGHRHPTKREMLSVVMAVFDPLGLIAHYVMYAKIILQEIWRAGCSWDDPIPNEQYLKWLRWIRLLPEVECIRIPRCYFSTRDSIPCTIELHTFVDASENGYAAVSYLLYNSGTITGCTIAGSKTRVSPLKLMSIPRLELQAALLGARLAVGITKSLTIPITSQTFWTDSRTVLSWLRSDQRRYRQFVAFRVSEILELSDVALWRWVPTADNVADDATKWAKFPDLSSCSRWLNGPSFLLQDKAHWPREPERPLSTNEELRAQYVGQHSAVCTVAQLNITFERFSRYHKLHRAVATVISIAHFWISVVKDNKLKRLPVSSDDLKRAEHLILSIVQRHSFGDEITALQNGKVIRKSSSIYRLSPLIDDVGLLHLGGRVRCSYYNDPIILPKNSYVTRLIVYEYHLRYHHGNSETVVNELRQAYWIPSLRVVVNKVRRACQLCRNRLVCAQPSKMSALPDARISAYSRPFSYVGVDYFGPLKVAVRRSREKRYGVLFTCLTTRAVHLELVCSLSTDSCIIAVRNFTARRGIPIELWSDNGTNFKGAERELQESFKLINQDVIVAAFTTTATRWRFIPPSSPHMGGVWERLVRSVKDVLYKILPSWTPSEELLRAALLEVEMCVNSRPLTYIPVDPDVGEALTPNHFLLGSSSGTKPLTRESGEVPLRRNWQAAQLIANTFWKRWISEYLPVITRRCKWFANVKPIEVDDFVYLVDSESPRNCWPRGRVVAVRKSTDGQVRSAVVKTTAGLYERPATKIAVLDLVGHPEDDIPRGNVTESLATSQQ